MSITQTVKIPDNHRLTIDIPPELPAGATVRVELKIIPFVKKQKESSFKKAGSSLTPHTDALLNILSNLGDINIDKIREERLAKHL